MGAQNEEVRSGYKLTKVGWIPEDWTSGRLKQLISKLEGGVSVNSGDRPATDGEYGILKTSSINNGQFISSENKLIMEDEFQRAKLSPTKGRLIISRMNSPDLVGACGYIEKDYPNLFIPDRLWQTKFNKASCDSKWLNYLLNTEYSRFHIKVLATGTSNSMKNISKPSLLSLKIPIPTIPEQKAISQFLYTWDKAIENLSQLITEKQQKKKALMQALLTGKKRFPAFTKASAGKPGFEGEWKEVKLGEYFTERKESNRPDLTLLSIGSNGVYPQTESNKKDTSNLDKAKYKRICKGDIGYNTMRMWQGRSALSALEGIVSPAYTIVTPKENADVLFFSYLFKFPYVVHRFLRNSQGLVDDTLNCKFKDFAIVKGLMQQLLTGKKRLKI